MYSLDVAQFMNAQAASFFSDVSGIARDQAQSQPELSVSTTGAGT